MEYEVVIGLEVHVQLRTASKIFCRCANRFGAEPNALVCAVCLGYPGTLPTLNREAVDQALRLAVALGCEIPSRSVFARKNYFYADLPKGYQISQFDQPLALRGRLALHDAGVEVPIARMHLEEDAGKLLHEAPGGGVLRGSSLVDHNRCGVPLVEIVTDPALRSAAQAQEYLQVLHQVLRYTDTSDANMEEGSLRCDANVSLRRPGAARLGTKVEVKNLNSFRNVARAIEHETHRQALVLDSGAEVQQETRSFDAASGTTRTLRGKEEAHDYRYFPEPDLPPLLVDEDRVRRLRGELPELPWTRWTRFAEQYGLREDLARQLCAQREVADYFEAVVAEGAATGAAGGAWAQNAANWTMTEVLKELNARGEGIESAVEPTRLAALLGMVARAELSQAAAKEVLAAIWGSEEEPSAATRRLGLGQVQDADRLEEWIAEVLAANPGPVEQLAAGEQKVAGFLVGQVMKLSQGRADPKLTRERLLSSVART
ncbi:MAG: Asp-tRNA(Asn)/Glu-tRNA(Gln) amidotransferase subunit GatB [Acidobacteria bacterium]|nr:MAG: Asp-tRNA(Asn)/Glu-tRNA(Gln) amidotransferase subunit GatB [Acidobacteriota bacterium]REK03668.1 MAG: Asp-tRNA(Asn)/Glu-tRNA(Gln) amidotransferase subunit GatB [Acidobacteriota bacterium]